MKEESIRYRKTIKEYDGATDTSARFVTVTEEANGFAVWREGGEDPTILASWHARRDDAIEAGVDLARQLIPEFQDDPLGGA